MIGIDHRAWRRGIDLLPDRGPATVEAWLRRTPRVEAVARDRNGGYGGAVTRALPDAIRVADRWHLPKNAGAACPASVQTAMPEIRSSRDPQFPGHRKD